MEAVALPMTAVPGLHCTIGVGQVPVAMAQCGQEHSIQSQAVNENAMVWNCQLVMREDQQGAPVW